MSLVNKQMAEKEVDNEESAPHCQVFTIAPQIKKRKLVIHLDLNNTILVSDAVCKQGPSAALNVYLSTVTWGQMSDKGEWTWLNDCTSVSPSCPDAINYFSQFGRSSDFTDTPMGQCFKDVQNRHLQLLEWPGEADSVFTLLGEDKKRYHFILPSFFHLLERLHQQGRHFSVLLRTYGTDLARVLPVVQAALKGKHPLFPQLRDVPLCVDLTPGRIRCSKRDVVLTRGSERVSTKANNKNIYDFFNTVTGIGGFQDHFDWWARNNFSSRGGKPFWIDPNDCDVQHIFIDDNIRINEEDSIVNCQMLLQDENGHRLRIVPTAELYKICLVQTDLLRAIADIDYFVKCIQLCEENYDQYLSNLHE
ncbi:uncharacterized protein LOC128666234 [Bombina bombina]|uniref:uncharacterized protein LOC128666234 n=1 Tax=Bombina bombina TaxID=8345 RepID=UPI00235A6F14|nr:uncharacterized protein LOC128666234 [Bombina bombina]XP_053576679.1 uncharacterized protein LOC128666234 [Bombina bombina]XP_053576680.1 uncharacterized protein LOC128666234 [Bombina bombina]